MRGVKTRNPRFKVYFEKINQPFNNLYFFLFLIIFREKCVSPLNNLVLISKLPIEAVKFTEIEKISASSIKKFFSICPYTAIAIHKFQKYFYSSIVNI